MTNKIGIFTSNSDNWATPQWLYDKLDAEFHFDLDVAASDSNHKCDRYFTREIDGLDQEWSGVVWCNPPYGKELPKWVKKAYDYAQSGGTVVMLLPARTDTRWWHNYCRYAQHRWIYKRLKFNDGDKPSPFPSVLVIWDNRSDRYYD